MPGKTTVLLCLLAAAYLPAGASPAGDGYLVLETENPTGERVDILRPDDPYPGGILRGARLVLKKVPVPRGPKTAETRPGHVYVPVELEIQIGRELTGGEVQLCVFSRLPPLYIEEIISRDSILLGEGEEEQRILLDTQSRISLFTGMEEAWDREILAFQESEHYRNCFFETDPGGRAEGLRRGSRFNFHSGAAYVFPPSPRFYWREIPRLSVSTSLAVRELDGLAVGPVRSLVNDTLKADWRVVEERRFYD